MPSRRRNMCRAATLGSLQRRLVSISHLMNHVKKGVETLRGQAILSVLTRRVNVLQPPRALFPAPCVS
jgi:hypothetical protein